MSAEIETKIAPGMLVKDIGCALAQELRRSDPIGHPASYGVVVKVFDWGLRLHRPGNPADEWDCENWEIV